MRRLIAISTLLRKELRALLPLAVLCFLLISGDVLTRPFTQQLDSASWASISAIEPSEGGFLAFVLWLLAFFVAFAAFPREHDESTIEFLFSLPLTRRAIFAAKVGAGAGVLVLFVALGQVTNWLLQLPNPQSYSGEQFRLDVALAAVLIQSSFVVVAYCHGLLASTLRVFGLLPYALAGLVLLVIETIDPSLGWLGPASICRLAYDGQELLVPWSTIAFHLAIAAVALALAYVGWMGPLDRLRDWLSAQDGGSTLRSVAVGSAIAGLAVIALIALVIVAVREDEANGPPPDDDAEPTGIAWQVAEARTDHYAFTYPTNLRSRALRLIGAADPIAESVARTLGAREVPFVTVDLAEQSGHHEGIAAGTRLRMGLVGQEDATRLEHVLAHETTHVFQGRESDRRLMTEPRGTRAFVEGSAEWVGYEVVPNERARRESRIVAAASWARHDLDLEDVLDDETLRARWDTTLSYALGEVWTEAIAEACGRAAVGDVMRAIGRDDAPRDLDAIALWQDALQHVGCSEVAARARMESLLARIADEERAAIDALPRAGAAVTAREDDAVVVRATLDRDAPEGARWGLRVRRDRAASDAEVRTMRGRVADDRRGVTFRVPRDLAFPRFDMQVCVVPEGGNWSFCEEWMGAR